MDIYIIYLYTELVIVHGSNRRISSSQITYLKKYKNATRWIKNNRIINVLCFLKVVRSIYQYDT